jgi:hypothetical protein
MPRLSLSLAFAIVPFSAYAEVCDKIAGEAWRPEDGPVGVFVDATTTAPWLIVVAFVLTLSAFSHVIAWLAAGAGGSLALVVAMDAWEDHAIIRAAYHEGCSSRASTILQVVVFAILALLFVVAPRFRSQIARAP